MFLLRTAFWLAVVIMILPADKQPADTQAATQTSSSLNAGNVFNAAKDTIYDMSSICERNPAICETGQAALETFGNKARYGAKMVMDFVSAQNDTATDTVAPIPASVSTPAPAFTAPVQSAPEPAPAQPAVSSQNTLNSTDLEPTWGGPFGADKA